MKNKIIKFDEPAFSTYPKILFEDTAYAVLYKPRGMPTAPLKKGERENLLEWFLNLQPEASYVHGKKEIEAGLIHRLDTPTSGLVLIAKTQNAFEIFSFLQEQNLIEKTYLALTSKNINAKNKNLIQSRFRPFGPGGKTAAPIFSNSKRFEKYKKIYTTTIQENKNIKGQAHIKCALTQGYRHQVRAHLASVGAPIIGDALYNKSFFKDFPGFKEEKIKRHLYPLQLYATGISFPNTDFLRPIELFKQDFKTNPENMLQNRIFFLLPPPDKKIL